MKKLGIGIAVLAVLLLVLPFGIGKMAEKRLNANLDKIIEQAPYFKIAERKWTGGWFKSEQVVTFEIADAWADVLGKKVVEDILNKEKPEAEAAMDAEGTEQQAEPEAGDAVASADGAAAADAAAGGEAPTEEAAAADAQAMVAKVTQFTIRNEVLHGPLLGLSGFGLARVDTQFEMSDETRKKIAEVFGPEPALEVRTRVGFFGGGTTTIKSEGRKLITDDDDTDVTYETFKLSVGVSRNADDYDIDGKLPSVTAKNKKTGGDFTLTGLSITGDGERVLGDLYDGEFAFKIKEVKFQERSDSEAVLVQDAHYVVDTRTKDDFVKVAAEFGTGAVKSADIAKAGVDIKEIHYNFSLRHLHAPTVAKMVAGMRAMYTTPLMDGSKVEDLVFAPMKEHASELLGHNPEFGIDRVGLVTPEGEIVAKGLIKLVGATTEDFSQAGAMGLIGKLDADITIEADQKVLEKFPNGATMAGGAVDSGYAKREGEKLICRIVFQKGELTINGKPQAIPGLGGPPPGAMEGQEVPPQE